MEKALPTTNETVLAAHINQPVGSACHNAQCSINDATITHMPTVRRLHTLCLIDIFVDASSDNNIKVVNDDGMRDGALLYIKI